MAGFDAGRDPIGVATPSRLPEAAIGSGSVRAFARRSGVQYSRVAIVRYVDAWIETTSDCASAALHHAVWTMRATSASLGRSPGNLVIVAPNCRLFLQQDWITVHVVWPLRSTGMFTLQMQIAQDAVQNAA
jgi:hypothetical protein